MGNHKAAGQFFTHLKKNEVRRPAWAELLKTAMSVRPHACARHTLA